MKRSRHFVILGLFAFLCAFPAFAEDHNLLLVFSFVPGPNGFVGDLNASGAIHEAATAEATVSLDANHILTANKTLHLAGGDIDMTVVGPLDMSRFPKVSLVGTWSFTGGTGIYTAVRGRGTCVVVGNLGAGTFSGAYEGRVKFANDKGDD